MAKSNVFTRAKSIRKKHPRKFKKWSQYVSYAAAHPARKKRKVSGKRKTTRTKTVRRSPTKKARKRSPHKRTTSRKRPTVLKQVERVSIQRTVAGRKKRRRRSHSPKKHYSRRRSVSGAGGGGLLTALAIGGLGYLLLTNMNKTPTTTYPAGTLPPVQQTGNYTRDSQSQDIVNYAIAAGMVANSIASLIEKLNTSSDQDVQYIYDDVSTSGNVEMYA